MNVSSFLEKKNSDLFCELEKLRFVKKNQIHFYVDKKNYICKENQISFYVKERTRFLLKNIGSVLEQS